MRKSNGNLAGNGTLYWYMTPGVVDETDLSGNISHEYVFFGGERVARKDSNGLVYYYFSDHLKTASVVTDSAGTIKAESDYYPWGGELQITANDSNHYKFTSKERDSETGLDYFGARYYSNGLGRFLTPDWAAKATAVPYADFADPQSLNLYTYVRNVPTSKSDVDGHCMGDECSGITVTVNVTTKPEHTTNEKQDNGKFKTGVRGELTITLKQNGKPMKDVPVKEKVTSTTKINGVVISKDPGANPNPVATSANGQVKDDVGVRITTDHPVSQAVSAGVQQEQATNVFTMQSTQILTFPGMHGATCSATYQRTLTNDDGNGNPSQTYTLKPSTEQPRVKEQR